MYEDCVSPRSCTVVSIFLICFPLYMFIPSSAIPLCHFFPSSLSSPFPLTPLPPSLPLFLHLSPLSFSSLPPLFPSLLLLPLPPPIPSLLHLTLSPPPSTPSCSSFFVFLFSLHPSPGYEEGYCRASRHDCGEQGRWRPPPSCSED